MLVIARIIAKEFRILVIIIERISFADSTISVATDMRDNITCQAILSICSFYFNQLTQSFQIREIRFSQNITQ